MNLSIKIQLVLLLLLVMPFTTIALQTSASSFVIIEVPVNEELDLYQAGSLASPYIANLTLRFDYVLTVIFLLHFTGNTFNINQFGADPALTNGINILYGTTSIINNQNYTANHMFFHRSVEGSQGIIRDDLNPKDNILKATIDITEQAPQGLLINTKSLHFYVQDDITALTSVTAFKVDVLGYKNEVIQDTQTSSNTNIFNIIDPNTWYNNQNSLYALVALALMFVFLLLFLRKRR